MRQFLPIKGPGGRALTTKEKAALVILSVTLILFVLTLLAGDKAFGSEPARNPIFALVAALARPIGMGIIAFYGVVLLWSGLIFFKGERAVRITPVPGRLLAALGITIGISGLLGIAQLEPAGDLGAVVGGAVGGTFGSAFGFPILLAMMILGAHLAGQGAWSAFRGASVGAAAVASAPPVTAGFRLPEQSPRMGGTPMLPADGDPSADERSYAVTRAMEEIERSQGVRIVEVDSTRTTIGEEVESTPAPQTDSQEAEVRRGLDAIAASLDARKAAANRHGEPEIAGETDESGWYRPTSMLVHSVQRPEPEESTENEATEDEAVVDETAEAGETDSDGGGWVEYADEVAAEVQADEDEDEDEDEEEEEEEEEEAAAEEAALEADEEEDDEDEADDEEEEDDEDADDYEEEDDEEEDDEEEDDEEDEPAVIVQPYLFPVASREIDEERAPEDVTGDSRAANFDWRGRPIS